MKKGDRKGDCSKGICPIKNGICLIGHKNICCNCSTGYSYIDKHTSEKHFAYRKHRGKK